MAAPPLRHVIATAAAGGGGATTTTAAQAEDNLRYFMALAHRIIVR